MGELLVHTCDKCDNFITIKKGVPLGSVEEVDVLEPIESETIPQVYTGSCEGDVPGAGDLQNSSEVSSDTVESTSPSPDLLISEDIQEQLHLVLSMMPIHIKDMFLRSCAHLSDEETVKFGQLLIAFEDIFAKNNTNLGLFTQVQHSIDTGDAAPIKQCMRHVPLGFAHEEDAKDDGVWSYSTIHLPMG